jgi:FAD/FMN-containing dehydrogenase
MIPVYNAPYYRGPAVKVGAGVQGAEAAEFAAQKGYRIVVGSCPTVGLAGGYTQGGGHSFLSGLYGFGADNVLEWEVVTASGQHVVATPTQHADLYWALSGGGGGTYGVVVSMTVRVFPDGQIAIASLSFDATTAGGEEPFWAAVDAFTTQLQPLVDRGFVAEFVITNRTLDLFGMMAPGYTKSALTALMTPMLSALAHSTHMELTTAAMGLAVSDSNSYTALYAAVVEPLTAKNIESPVIGGRFVSRSNMAENASAVNAAIRAATAGGHFYVAVTALNAHGTHRVAMPIASNAVQPALHDAFMSLIITSEWNWTQPWDDAAELQTELWEMVMPPLEAATLGADAYINEANWQQPQWQDVFYGDNYARLRSIKAKYDPSDVFYGLTAVGSEAWEADAEGRLCRVGW